MEVFDTMRYAKNKDLGESFRGMIQNNFSILIQKSGNKKFRNLKKKIVRPKEDNPK